MTIVEHGDTLVCYGEGGTSKLISAWLFIKTFRKYGFRKRPSHIAFLAGRIHPLVYESTTQKVEGLLAGVRRQEFATWLKQYQGRVELWSLRVPQTDSGKMEMQSYCEEAWGRQVAYDARGAVKSGLSILRNTENGEALFCSEFWAFAFRNGGSIGQHINCSEVTPYDVIHFPCLRFVKVLKS